MQLKFTASIDRVHIEVHIIVGCPASSNFQHRLIKPDCCTLIYWPEPNTFVIKRFHPHD